MGKVSLLLKLGWLRDPYPRHVLFSFDKPIPKNWHTARSQYSIGIVTAHGFTKKIDLDVSEGIHYVELGVLSPCDDKYLWHGEIYTNGTLLVTGDDICFTRPIRAYFTVPFSPVLSKMLSRGYKFFGRVRGVVYET